MLYQCVVSGIARSRIAFSSASALHGCCKGVDAQQDQRLELLVVWALAPASKQFDLEGIDDVGVAVAFANRLLDDFVVIKKVALTSDRKHGALGKLELCYEALVDALVAVMGIPRGHFEAGAGHLLLRIVVGTLLVFFAAFCSYGFLASYEPGNHYMWKVGYAILAVVSLCGGYKLIRSGVQLLKQSR